MLFCFVLGCFVLGEVGELGGSFAGGRHCLATSSIFLPNLFCKFSLVLYYMLTPISLFKNTGKSILKKY